MKKDDSTKTTACSVVYHVKNMPLAPLHAKWRLVYWGYVVFFTTERAAKNFQDGLPYYQQEDSMLEKIDRRYKKRK